MGSFIRGLVDPTWASIALLIFLGFFVVMLFWVYRPRGKEVYDEMARIPFEKGSE